MTTRDTIRDHHFTGNAFNDFGICWQEMQLSGLLEETEEQSMRSANTGVSTVKISNIKPRSASSTSSATDGTSVSSLDYDMGSSKTNGDSLIGRLVVYVGLIFVGLSFLGVALFWIIYSPIQSKPNQEHPQSGFFGTIMPPPPSPPPENPSEAPRKQPADLFTSTGEPSLECPPPLEPVPPLPGKKGIAVTFDDYDRMHLGTTTKLSPYWNYSHGPRRPSNQPSLMEFVPMIPNSQNYADTSRTIVELAANLPRRERRVLGFHEPDRIQDPLAMSVDEAIETWELLEDLHVPLVSPSTMDPTGSWMRDFMQHADNKCLRIDWIGVHWFGGDSFHNFKTQLEQIYSMYGKRPLLLTEFAIADWKAQELKFNRYTESDVLEFVKKALPWLEEQDWIAGYAWYNFASNHTAGGPAALFDAQGKLTPVGQFYASIREDNPMGDQNILA